MQHEHQYEIKHRTNTDTPNMLALRLCKCAWAGAGYSRPATKRSNPHFEDPLVLQGLGTRALAGLVLRRADACDVRVITLSGASRTSSCLSDMAVSSPLRAFFANMLLRGDSFFCCFAKGLGNVKLRCLTCLTGAAELKSRRSSDEARETHTRGRWNTHLQLGLCRHRSALSTCGAASLTTS